MWSLSDLTAGRVQWGNTQVRSRCCDLGFDPVGDFVLGDGDVLGQVDERGDRDTGVGASAPGSDLLFEDGHPAVAVQAGDGVASGGGVVGDVDDELDVLPLPMVS